MRNPASCFLTAVAVLGVVACGPEAGEFTKAKLMQAVQTSPNRLDLREYVQGDWERVCFFRGPMPATAVQSQLGFAWPDVLDTGIDKSKQDALVVFTKGFDVVHSVMLDRYRGDFTALQYAYCVPRDSAVFKVLNPDKTAFRALVPRDPTPPGETPAVTNDDVVQMMVAAARHVYVYAASSPLIDPRTPHAPAVASALGVKVGTAQEAIVCRDPSDGKTCRWTKSGLMRLSAPEDRAPKRVVRIMLQHASPSESWRTTESEYEVTVELKYGRWQGVERRVIREGS
jgi:hypothetical protein